jgi:hypothetical protein
MNVSKGAASALRGFIAGRANRLVCDDNSKQ